MGWAWVGLPHRAALLLCPLPLRWPLLRLSFTLLKVPATTIGFKALVIVL